MDKCAQDPYREITTRGVVMRCPFCGNIDTQVKDSRPAEDHVSIRRRRFCVACGGRFTTYERVQLRDLVVIKSNGKREDFDRDKLERSIRIALQKRPVEHERMEQMISGIVRHLESLGETDINSNKIGEIVMEALARIDTVAYVRFASVYKNFQAADDFDKFVDRLLLADAYEVKIIEDFSDLKAENVKNEIVENAQDTITLLDSYVDELDVNNLDKNRLKTMLKGLYVEASNMEI